MKPFIKTISCSRLSIASAILLCCVSAAHAGEAQHDFSSSLSGACNYSLVCTDNQSPAVASNLKLAQQDGSYIYALTEDEGSRSSAGKSKPGYPKMLWEDTKHVLTAPTRWDRQEWQDMGWAALGVVGVMAVIDRPVQDAMRRIAPDNDQLTPDNSKFLHEIERFGREYSLGVLGGFYIAGALNNDENAIEVAQDGLTSVIIASGIITTVTKVAVGRARPRDDVGHTHFRPFGGDQSFPSGHTSHAFAIASVIANHYDEPWITYSSYGVASLVGVARSYHGGHFASDIVAGAMIGTMVGKSVVEYNKPMRSSKIALMPETAPGLTGLRLVSSF